MVVYSDEMTGAEMVALCLGISSCNQNDSNQVCWHNWQTFSCLE